ncbi:unnamed protein product [Arabis nemorensis]|uniref:Replication protein A 70 kDa DNA-binding subunit B/D first OB fold domain-containing protein n=1 Tax=Arabis nemorensis TaxID=586526 RepID=A0A565BL69_9BRAS|nr:unnamed protein product [Arabis nemorensis]
MLTLHAQTNPQQLRNPQLITFCAADMVDINDIPFYKTLNQLRVGFSTYPIVGRILRLWETQNIWKNGEIIGLTFLLLDEKVDVINCFINVRRTSLYKNIIQDGLIYSINRFYVTHSNNKYKLTHTPFSISFTNKTMISQIVGNVPKIPMHKYTMRNYNDLKSLANTNKELPDIVGQIRFVEGIELNDPNSTRPIVLRLRMQRKSVVRVALWDNVAASFRKDFGIEKLQRFTILITSINPKIRQGNLQLDSTAATRILKKETAVTTKQIRRQIKSKLNSLANY